LLKQAVCRHQGELAAYMPGTADNCDAPLRPGQYRLYNEEVMTARLESAKKSSERLLQSEIGKVQKLGNLRRMPTAPSWVALDELSRDFPHCEPVIALLRQRTALAQVTPGRVFTLPPILMVGAGGVGKTAFAEAVGRLLGMPTRRVDMGSNTASFTLAGSHSSWSTARPGAVWTLLHESGSAGVILVDEIDKAAQSNYPPTGPLYTLLEPASARTFADEYVEVEIDASHIVWMATCNDAEKIEPALRTRFREFLIEAPTAEQMRAVAQSVYRERRKHAPWGEVFPAQLDEAVTQAMSVCTPRELGALIEAAAAHAATCHRTCIAVEDVKAAQTVQHRQSNPIRRLGFL
jgi:ATP-dependent Lon protease